MDRALEDIFEVPGQTTDHMNGFWTIIGKKDKAIIIAQSMLKLYRSISVIMEYGLGLSRCSINYVEMPSLGEALDCS